MSIYFSIYVIKVFLGFWMLELGGDRWEGVFVSEWGG